MNASSNKSRRVILKKAVSIGVVVASIKEAPSRWSKPVIDTILLPAHAQTSPVVSCCESVPPSGTSVTETQEIKIIFRVLPNPGKPVLVTFTATCDSTLSKSGVFERESNADGTIELSATPSGENCSVGTVMGLEAECMPGKVGRCEWPVIGSAVNAVNAVNEASDSSSSGSGEKSW